MSERPRRRDVSDRKKRANAALRRARELRESGVSRAQQLEDESSSEDDLFLHLPEEEDYRRTVAQRRREARNFVVGDGALGYYDDGEDHFSEEEEYERVTSSSRGKRKPKKGKKEATPLKKKKTEKKKKSRSLASMLSAKPNSKVKLKRAAVTANDADVLNDVLNAIDDEDSSEDDITPFHSNMSSGNFNRFNNNIYQDDEFQKEGDELYDQRGGHDDAEREFEPPSYSLISKRSKKSVRKNTSDEENIAPDIGIDAEAEEVEAVDFSSTPPLPTHSASTAAMSDEEPSDSEIVPLATQKPPKKQKLDSSRSSKPKSASNPTSNSTSSSTSLKPKNSSSFSSSASFGSKDVVNVPSVSRPSGMVRKENDQTQSRRMDFETEMKSKDIRIVGQEKVDDIEFSEQKQVLPKFQSMDEPSSQGLSRKQVELIGENNKTLLMYYFDAYEDPYHSPGTIWLFGKALVPSKSHGKSVETVSCCVAVKNMERNVYVLPREYKLRDAKDPNSETDEKVDMTDVREELKEVYNKKGIAQWMSKSVKRKYSFELRKEGVPFEAEYLKCVYSFNFPAFNRNTKGKTFSRMLGTQTSALELFILKRRLMGPCWIAIDSPTKPRVNISWCKREFEVGSQKLIKVVPQKDAPPVPQFSVMSLYFKHIINQKTKIKEIVMISAVIHKAVDVVGNTANETPHDHFTLLRPLRGQAMPYDLKEKIKQQKMNVKICGSEREMFNFFLVKLHSCDPDVLVGHNMLKYKLEMLLSRFAAEKVSYWSKLGRLRKSRMPNSHRAAEYGAASGRLICDTLTSAMEFIREKTYTLDHLVKALLNVQDRREIDPHETRSRFSSAKNIVSLVYNCLNDALLQLRLMFKLAVLPLTRQLTELCGNLWNRSLMTRRAERNEYVLLHEFHKLKYIAPEKYTSKERKIRAGIDPNLKSSKRKKTAYSGGLVLEPQKGFYDKFVLLLDFNSLYPSIIREWNICFSTVKHWELETDDEMPEVPKKGEDGVLPKVIGHFLVRRKAVKDMLKSEKDPERRISFDIRQKALKLVANSMYGCLGFDSSRFYCKPMAALITALGRESLTNAKKAAESLETTSRIEVIYGDTDSIMVHTNSDDIKEAKKVASEIKKAVNKGYNHMFLELDAIYKCILLLRKKKYAALPVVEQNGTLVEQPRELKGLDMVRRDWCPLSKDVGKYVLDELLSSKSREEAVENIHEYLEELKKRIDSNRVPKGKYIITKGLTKAIEEYADAKQFSHVQVAMQMKNEGKIVNPGDHIPYIITEGSSSSVADRAVHAAKILKQNTKNTAADQLLKIDKNWYITHQILPPVARLCDVISETSPGQLAERLGLDPSRFQQDTGVSVANVMEGEEELNMGVSVSEEAERFKNHPVEDAFEVSCPYCLISKRTFRDIYNLAVDGNYMLVCENAACKGRDADSGGVLQSARDVICMKNSLSLQFRRFVQKYYDREAQCDDPTCRKRTRANPTTSCDQVGCQGRMVPLYSARDLYDQLCYYKWIFDLRLADKRVDMENKQRKSQHEVKLRTDKSARLHQIDEPRLPHHVKEHFRELKRFASSMIEQSAYYYVDTKALFSMFAPK